MLKCKNVFPYIFSMHFALFKFSDTFGLVIACLAYLIFLEQTKIPMEELQYFGTVNIMQSHTCSSMKKKVKNLLYKLCSIHRQSRGAQRQIN